MNDARHRQGAWHRAFALMLVCAIASTGLAARRGDPPPSFESARDHYLHGRYDEAVAVYDALSANPADAVRATCERRHIDILRGTLDEGIARLIVLEPTGKKSADYHAALADLYDRRGQSAQAVASAKKAIAIDDEHLEANFILGRVCERLGRKDEAVRAYSLFDDLLTSDSLPTSPEALTLAGRGFYRYSVLTRTNLVQRVRHILREIYQEAFDFVDKKYWPARLAAGELLMDRHNHRDAADEFEAILAQNPNVPDAHVNLGRTLLENWDFEQVEAKAKAALAINPRHVPALLLLADCRMTERRFADAAVEAQKVLDANGESLDAMGILAAAKMRLCDRDGAEALERRAKSFSDQPAAYYLAVGRWLAAARQYDQAHDYLTRATKAAPWESAPFVELGLLCMESGREADARKALEAAHEIDSFNQRTFDVLGLLDQIDKFGKHETEHFIIKYDRKSDTVIVPYVASYLESIHDEICRRYDTTLKRKTSIEMHPTHEGFSLRISHRPFIATIGACTGPVIAIMTPRGRAPFGNYNWADVLRHEFTHTVTLAATENRIPHWLTEGLAVYEEPAPRSWGQKLLLTTAVRRDRLFTLATIDMGFIRPTFPESRSQAYAQSEWMVEFIEARFEKGVVPKLLAAFRAGRDVEAAFRDVLNTPPAEFDKAFEAWALAQADAWALPWLVEEKVNDVKALLKDAPDDAALLARLACAHFIAGEPADAESVAREAIEKDRDNPLALEILGRLLIGRMLAEEDKTKRRELIDEAEPHLRRLRRLAPENAIAIQYLGYVEQAWEQWPEAIDLYLAYQSRYPEDPDSYRRLAAIYKGLRNTDAAREQLERLAERETDDPFVLAQIAQGHADAGAHEAAKRWWIAALHVTPFDPNVHGALADACFATGDLPCAEREYRTVTELLPDDPIGYEGLADVFERTGDVEKAKTYRDRATALGGSSPKPDAVEAPH